MNEIMKFDIILANPPFNIGERMLIKWFDIANEICTVQPSTWLLGKKQKKDIVKNVDAWEKTEIESIQGNEFFDAGISGVMAIQHFIRGKEETQQNSDYGKQNIIIYDGKGYKECEEINKFSNDKLLMEFKNIVEPLYQNDNLQNYIKYGEKNCHEYERTKHLELNPDPNWWCVKISNIRGNKDTKTGLPKDDFYTLISNNPIEIYRSTRKYEIMSKEKNKNGNCLINTYFAFNDKNIQENFINYLKTYFIRLCLYLVKNNTSLVAGELKYLPWFNFSDPIFNGSPEDIDIALFKKYHISQDIIDHILNILPNYYNLDLDKYKQKGQIVFNGKQYNKCEEIRKYSNDDLLVEFKNIVEPLYLKDNLQNHIKIIYGAHGFGNTFEKNPNPEWWVFRITRFSVHPDGKHTNWCILSKNNLKPYKFKDIQNIKEKNGNMYLKYYIPFINKQEVINLINYTCSYFCRCCLYLIQTSYELGGGECNFIPWFDFSDPVFSKSPSEIDDYLFKKYNIRDDIRKHIETILPDYYNIRK